MNYNNLIRENSIYVKDFYIQNFINFYEGQYKLKVLTCSYISEKKFRKFILSKNEPDLVEDLLLREENIKSLANQNRINFLPYEVEYLFSKLLEEELLLIENISKLLDDFFIYQDF